MSFNPQALGISAFASYFGLDTLTTCIAIGFYGAGAESNPAMAAAIGVFGLAGLIGLKLILSLCLVMPSYLMAVRPNTKAIGYSALSALLAGGMLIAINNFSALATGTSLLYVVFGTTSFTAPGILLAATMLIAGAVTYLAMSLDLRHFGLGAHF